MGKCIVCKRRDTDSLIVLEKHFLFTFDHNLLLQKCVTGASAVNISLLSYQHPAAAPRTYLPIHVLNGFIWRCPPKCQGLLKRKCRINPSAPPTPSFVRQLIRSESTEKMLVARSQDYYEWSLDQINKRGTRATGSVNLKKSTRDVAEISPS